MSSIYKTEFICRRYDSPERLAEIMQELYADGWRADSVKLSKDVEEGGWTIFSRTYKSKPPLMDVDFPAQIIWNILNDAELFGNDYDDPRRYLARQIVQKLTDWYEKNLARE